MMSIVTKTKDGEYIMFTKGADSSIIPRLDMDEDGKLNVYNRAKQFAQDGHRIMMFAYRRFNKKTYLMFKKFVNGQHLIKHDDLASNYDFFENKLTFLGITAVEDAL